MYYETKAGDDELRVLYDLAQREDEENNDEEEEEEEEEPKVKKERKTRRSEASRLEEDNAKYQLSPDRPKRTSATTRASDSKNGQRRIDEFIAKKRSPVKTVRSPKTDSVLPPVSTDNHELCPICDRLIPNGILEVHTNACITQKSEAAQALVEKVQQRTKTEAKVKEILFPRATRKTLAAHLVKTNSETTTCTSCGMQMTVSRLESQHRDECRTSRK